MDFHLQTPALTYKPNLASTGLHILFGFPYRQYSLCLLLSLLVVYGASQLSSLTRELLFKLSSKLFYMLRFISSLMLLFLKSQNKYASVLSIVRTLCVQQITNNHKSLCKRPYYRQKQVS